MYVLRDKVNTRLQKTKRCKACGNEFLPELYKQSAQYCPNPECQNQKVQNSRRSGNKKIARRKVNRHLNLGKMKQSSVRICRKCGRDAYPNYFYCPVCHRGINPNEEYEDMSNGI